MTERKTPGGATEEIARLKGCRFVAVNETSENDQLHEARIKFITSQDTITARNLYGHFFDFFPTHKACVTTNHKPIVRGTDEGIWRRLHLIPFTVTIPASAVEKDFRERRLEASKRLDEIPGVGPALATALVASVADPKAFRSGRDFSAWIGLVPKQRSSGGKDKLGSISKQGDRYLRSLFTAGALAVIRYAKIHGSKHRPWLTALLARRPTKVAAIALANKIARMAWAMMARDVRYKEPIALAA